MSNNNNKNNNNDISKKFPSFNTASILDSPDKEVEAKLNAERDERIKTEKSKKNGLQYWIKKIQQTMDPSDVPATPAALQATALTEQTNKKKERVERATERKRQRLARKKEALDRIREAANNVTTMVGEKAGEVTALLTENQKEVTKLYDDLDKVDEEEDAAIEKIEEEYDAAMERITLHASTPAGSAVTSPASSRSSSFSEKGSPAPLTLAGYFEGVSDNNQTKSATKTPKHGTAVAKKPSPVAENEESIMPVLSGKTPVFALFDRATKSHDIVNGKDISDQIGVDSPPTIWSMQQIGKLVFAIVGNDKLAGGTVVCLGPPGFFASVKYALVGRHPEFQTKINVLEECGKNIVSISAFSKGDKGLLATLSSSGEFSSYAVLDNKVSFLEGFEKADWFPEGFPDAEALTLTKIQMGSDFVASMDDKGDFHVICIGGDSHGHTYYFRNDDIVRIDPEAGLASGEQSILAWGDKVGRNNRARRVFFLSKSDENPWESVLAEIKGVTAKIGVASQSGFLALGINGVSYVSFTGEPKSWKRVNWGEDRVVKSSIVAATDDCFLAVPDDQPGKILLVSSDSPVDPKSKKIEASLLDLDARLKDSGKAIQEVLMLAGSSQRISLCIYERDLATGEATGKTTPATDGAHE